ncbi:MAG TPA: hypothetical protein VHP11_15225 [Tepidisphaeraceae bacterium]|nr:hypothetical protein [Tepidisphaeraceae bacterium]
MRVPRLANASEAGWQQQAQITYVFARHARHDVMSIQSTLNMLEAAQRMSAGGGGRPLPPALQGEQMQARVRGAIRHLSGMAHDVMLLSQTANVAAYEPAGNLEIAHLLEDAIQSRLKGDDPLPAGLMEGVPAGEVPTLGVMLSAAVAAFYFQWTPGCHAHQAASRARIRQAEGGIELSIPADDVGLAMAFAERMREGETVATAAMIDTTASVPTAELVLWIARFIVQVHGGTVEVDSGESSAAYRIGLPLVASGSVR